MEFEPPTWSEIYHELIMHSMQTWSLYMFYFVYTNVEWVFDFQNNNRTFKVLIFNEMDLQRTTRAHMPINN
jgi:hypothetical protein